MIERKILKENMKEFEIEELVTKKTKGVGHSKTKVQRTPLGDKIVIHASRPGLVVGRKGSNIIKMTKLLKDKFKLDNPQIEISEVENPNLDANIIAERIANSLERFGAARFKGVGHKAMSDVMRAGALGVEIIIGGRGVPGERAKSWRFYNGYLKKCGNVAVVGVKKAHVTANLKTGTIGVKVRIMPPDVQLPDKIITLEEKEKIEAENKLKEDKAKKAEESKKEIAEEKKKEENKTETKTEDTKEIKKVKSKSKDSKNKNGKKESK
tara:strand:- start:9725 stop:10525 length:801 start_codon:yes stop_codon:yes gene_type:complete